MHARLETRHWRPLRSGRRRGRPTDRLPPGKGVVKWKEMLGLLAEKGYTGYLSYEAPNPEQWERSPYDVAREGVELTRKLLKDFVPSYQA